MFGDIRGDHQAVSHGLVGHSLGRSSSDDTATEVGVHQHFVVLHRLLDGCLETVFLGWVNFELGIVQLGVDGLPGLVLVVARQRVGAGGEGLGSGQGAAGGLGRGDGGQRAVGEVGVDVDTADLALLQLGEVGSGQVRGFELEIKMLLIIMFL